MRLFTNREQVKRVWEVRESSLGVVSHVPGEALTWEGWEDSAVAPEKLGRYLRDLRKLLEQLRVSQHVLRTLRPRLRPQPHQLRFADRNRALPSSASSWRTPPTWWSAMADRFPENTATARPGRSCCRECSARNWCRPSVNSKLSGIPHWKMNPGKVVEPYRMDENLRLGAGLQAVGAGDALPVSPTTTAAWPTPRCAASE